MNFTKHYFEQEPIQEGPVADVIAGGPGTALKAGAKGIGRAIANVARGATGRTKTIAFEPNWLKIMKPVPVATYKDLINKYANWKTQKTKLGSKKNFTIVDNRDGRLGEYSKDKFLDLLAKFDPKMTNVQMDAEIPPRMHVYIYNNKGKAVFFDLPMDEGGKKRTYAVGLDNKAERAFRQVHGMPFQDYELVTGKNEKEEEEPKTAKEKGLMKFQYEVPKDQYNKLIPKSGAKLAIAAKESTFSLLDIFEEDVLGEKALEVDGKKAVTIGPKGEWYRLTSKNKMLYNTPISSFKNVIAVNKKGEPDEDLQAELDKEIKIQIKNKEPEDTENKEQKPTEEDGNGKLYVELQDELDSKTPPSEVKPSEKTKSGWRFVLKNGGIIFIYQTTDNKNMIGFDEKAKKVVDSKDLINKYKLEVSTKNPEVESPE